MESNNTGGPAFPLVHEVVPEPGHPQGTRAIKVYEGMTLRDYFAANALPRVMQDGKRFSQIAEDAYDMADAMLKARE